jgi:hypothetical protein
MLADWRIVITRDEITLAIAILGAGLGIINFFIDLWRNRLSLNVVPRLYASAVGGGSYSWNISDRSMIKRGELSSEGRLCVEVQNDGNKEVTVDAVGFMRKGSAHRFVILRPILSNNKDLPVRLQPGESFLAYSSFTPEELWKSQGPIDYAIAETATDRVFKGTSPILEEIKKRFQRDDEARTS